MSNNKYINRHGQALKGINEFDYTIIATFDLDFTKKYQKLEQSNNESRTKRQALTKKVLSNFFILLPFVFAIIALLTFILSSELTYNAFNFFHTSLIISLIAVVVLGEMSAILIVRKAKVLPFISKVIAIFLTPLLTFAYSMFVIMEFIPIYAFGSEGLWIFAFIIAIITSGLVLITLPLGYFFDKRDEASVIFGKSILVTMFLPIAFVIYVSRRRQWRDTQAKIIKAVSLVMLITFAGLATILPITLGTSIRPPQIIDAPQLVIYENYRLIRREEKTGQREMARIDFSDFNVNLSRLIREGHTELNISIRFNASIRTTIGGASKIIAIGKNSTSSFNQMFASNTTRVFTNSSTEYTTTFTVNLIEFQNHLERQNSFFISNWFGAPQEMRFWTNSNIYVRLFLNNYSISS